MYKEVNEDGTVTEYHEEQYVIESDQSRAEKEGDKEPSGLVMLEDTESVKVFQVSVLVLLQHPQYWFVL